MLAAAGAAPTDLAAKPYLGGGTVLSHRSAAALWGMEQAAIHLTVRGSRYARRPGLTVRRRPALAATEISWHDGLPATSPVQTLSDVAAELAPIAIERAVNDVDKRDLIDPEALRNALDDHTGEPGVRPLRDARP